MDEATPTIESGVARVFEGMGRLAIMIGRTILSLKHIFISVKLILNQMYFMGVRSLWLIAITSIFTGGVSAWQAAYQFESYVPMRYLGGAVGKAVMMELGPVLTALVLAGRVGAGIAAELGTMRVTEQIDAMESMAVNPIRYLVMPRIVAGFFMFPVLTMVANFIAMIGAYMVAVRLVGMETETFMNGFKQFFQLSDLFAGLVKSAGFGLIVSIMGCFHGYYAVGGAEGVGTSTTKAVVSGAVLILVGDFVLATFLFQL